MDTVSDVAANSKKAVVCLFGPTATGKTDIAVELVKRFSCEIISVDSALIYRGMDVGTAKPEASVLEQAPHRLINICEPTETYSVARFREDALREIDDIHSAGKVPLLVGGTMLYFRALLDGLSPLPSSDPIIRQKLEVQAREGGLAAMHERLMEVDPVAAARIHCNDPQRVLRALEVFEIAKVPITTLQKQKMPRLSDTFEVHTLGLMPADRSLLHARINQRFELMLEAGFIDEMKKLMKAEGIHPNLPSMRSVGYRQAWQYLEGELSREEMIEKAVIATRQLAKRQITWMRSTPTDYTFDPFELSMKQILRSIELNLGRVISG